MMDQPTFVAVPLRERIADLVRVGLRDVQASGALPAFAMPEIIPVDQSRHEAHGDYASPVCMGLAKVLRRPPMQIAQAVARHIPTADFVAQIEVAPPGYLNFALSTDWLVRQVPVILAAGEAWGNVALGSGKRAQVEFVSANPTGPITIGSARNAVIGDTLASVLAAAGYAVEREYYVNDAGSKVRNFGASIFARYAQALGADVPFPEQGYPAAYVTELAQRAREEFGDRYLTHDRDAAVRALGVWGIARILDGVRDDLAQLRVHFDTWFSEKSLYESGLFEQMMEKLRGAGYIVEHDDATWFRHPDLEKDAVLIRSPQVIPNPEDRPTYLASDIPYLWNKIVERGFDKAVYVWGADHHGDVPRVQAAARALGVDVNRLVFIIYQMVTLLRGGQEVRMSKSSGEFVTLRELVDEVGPDPIRFMMLTRTVDVTLDFDLDLAVEQSDRNPVYYVQYAHTRIAGVLRKAAEEGCDLDALGDPALLMHPSELALIRKMLALPEVITLAANSMAPHYLTFYATELASLFHVFYRDCRIVSTAPEDAALTQARLMLSRAAQHVLARVLHLMGMDAPERM
ncbi:MAG TPA: arginine--tRNA ligase [Anaerolineae bacterium]|nr:arginine--tRNA ligase [Anaerolineae bacterium]HQI84001.1 arginine--tRNA ligase [Anaerolineae bacterium]